MFKANNNTAAKYLFSSNNNEDGRQNMGGIFKFKKGLSSAQTGQVKKVTVESLMNCEEDSS